MNKAKLLADCQKSVETWDLKLAKTATQAAADAGIEPKEIIADGLGKGMEVIGVRFDKAEVYLPQVVAASKAMEVGLAVLKPLMEGKASSMKATVVMGTVEGDIHEIGKNVCCAMLRGAGFNVIDAGADVSVEDFIDAAEENDAKVVGASALMTTTLEIQKDLVDGRDEMEAPFKVIVGGAPCGPDWAKEINADGYSETANDIMTLVASLVE
ncbi:MAG TPA: cobalamin-dependent protein [Candidatus Methanomethylophilaceae archaeon]|nr:cobalamin-dependent protein [Candidatus Methanomethylophilaceae archaeon]